MTQTLERPRVETVERPPEPDRYRTPGVVRWIPWIVILSMLVVGSVAIWQAQMPVDDSFDRVEQIRFEQLAANRIVVDQSDEVAEGIRMAGLTPVPSDTSFDRVEAIRFEQIRTSAEG